MHSDSGVQQGTEPRTDQTITGMTQWVSRLDPLDSLSPTPPGPFTGSLSQKVQAPLGAQVQRRDGRFPPAVLARLERVPRRYKGCCVAEHSPRQHSDAPGPRAGQQVRSALQQEPPLPVLPRRVSICTMLPRAKGRAAATRGSHSELRPEGLQPAASPRAPPGLVPFSVLPDSSVPAPAVLGGARGPQGLTSRDAGLVTGCRGCRDCRG